MSYTFIIILPMKKSDSQYLRSSLITHSTRQSYFYKFLTKVDLFSFLPYPKDNLVSTKISIFGSIIFIALALSYFIVNFYFFITDNPPTVEIYPTRLNASQIYELPRIAVAFMNGTTLNDTGIYEQFFNFTFTKELKGTNLKEETKIAAKINDEGNDDWLTRETTSAYKILRSPSEKMYANGLLYSTDKSNYTKLLISMCNLNKNESNCSSEKQIRSLTAKGRIFLFIEDQRTNLSVSKQNSQTENTFQISNFFLQPGIYKRVTVSFKVVQTSVLPDYFNRFSIQNQVRLLVDYVSQQSSNTSINSQQNNETSLEMLGIVFQLSPQVQKIRMVYLNIIDYISKWGAFINVLYLTFSIVFLNWNSNKFYQKNPSWKNFREITRKKLRNSQSMRQQSQQQQQQQQKDRLQKDVQ